MPENDIFEGLGYQDVNDYLPRAMPGLLKKPKSLRLDLTGLPCSLIPKMKNIATFIIIWKGLLLTIFPKNSGNVLFMTTARQLIK